MSGPRQFQPESIHIQATRPKFLNTDFCPRRTAFWAHSTKPGDERFIRRLPACHKLPCGSVGITERERQQSFGAGHFEKMRVRLYIPMIITPRIQTGAQFRAQPCLPFGDRDRCQTPVPEVASPSHVDHGSQGKKIPVN